jgi:hypothetical protein
MPPEPFIVCRFAAEPPQDPLPHGGWADTLQAEFLAACLRVDADGEDLGEPQGITWFPDRTWSGRTYVPATARTSTGFELYGYVSFSPAVEDEPATDFSAWVDFTDETSERHPEWRMDIAEEVVGGWRGADDEVAAMTLVWGVPLLRGGVTATAELAGAAVDQCRITESRFTLLAPDAYADHYLEIALWDAQDTELARESLYEDDGEDEEEEA